MRNEKAPASARVSAANSVLDRAGIGVRKGEQAALAKDPENMNLDELNTFIQAGAAALASKRSSATAEDAVIVLDSAQNKADEHDIPSLDQ
jgi:ribosomal protein L12E/L44/L45/RPP1/RPP2